MRPDFDICPEERKEATVEKLLYRPKEAAQMLGIGRATLYELMHAGRIRSVKDGGMRFITLDALHEYVRQLEDQADEVA
jgi:excisionase family DNA binding protein